MANQRLTDRTALASQTANDDLYMVVDTSDTTGSSSGTSKKVDAKFVIQTDIKNVNLDLDTTPLTLVAAPGAGHIIQPITITLIYTYGTTDSTLSNYVYVGYDSSDTGNYLVRQRDFIKNQSTNGTYVLGAPNATSALGTLEETIDNKALYLYSSVDLGGDGTIKAYVTYQIVKIT
jgi:hypothetical protein|tara:strand:- start:332 stop:859 length:528 start_codon:yes stop_codon:yes gene_type:complete